MFKFLKEKLKDWTKKISKEVEESIKESKKTKKEGKIRQVRGRASKEKTISAKKERCRRRETSSRDL